MRLPLQSMLVRLARPLRCMLLLMETKRCGRWMSAVRTYGATTLTGKTSGPERTPALWITASSCPRRLTCLATLCVCEIR